MKKQPIMVCITPQLHCINIISAAKQMALKLKAPILVFTCLPTKCDAVTRSSNLKILNEISKKCDVEITIFYGDNPALVIAKEAGRRLPIHIFMGKDNGFINEFRNGYSLAPISIVDDSVLCTVPAEDVLINVK